MNKEKVNNLIKQPLFWAVIGSVVIIGSLLYFNAKDNVAMRINDSTFSHEEFNQIINQIVQEIEMYGISANKEEIVEEAMERLIQQTLILNYAKERGMEVSQDEIDSEFDNLMSMYQVQDEQEFLSLLKEQGIKNKEEVEKLLSLEIKVNKLVDIYGEEIDITDKDVKEAYSDYYSQMEDMREMEGMEGMDQEIPSFKEMEMDLRSQLVQEKVTPLILSKIEELKEEADIEVFFNIDDLEIREPQVDESLMQQPEMEIDPEQIQ